MVTPYQACLTLLAVCTLSFASYLLLRYWRPDRATLYEVTLSHHLVSITAAIALAVGVTGVLIHFVDPHNAFDINQISFGDVARGTLNSFYRMVLAFILSLIVSIPLALFMAKRLCANAFSCRSRTFCSRFRCWRSFRSWRPSSWLTTPSSRRLPS
jgi:hypothetical protein